MTKPITINVSEDAVQMFGGNDTLFAREVFEAAVVKWYDEGRITSGKGAEFLDLLFRHKVSPFQYTPEELAAELKGV